MSKEEFVELLKAKGYAVELDDDGTPLVIDPNHDRGWKGMCKLRKECGYEGSAGWKPVSRNGGTT